MNTTLALIIFTTMAIVFGVGSLLFMVHREVDISHVPLLVGMGCWAALFFIAAFHLSTWQQRENQFYKRYDPKHLIHLGDKTAKWVDKNERICHAKVAYKPSAPHGELFIIAGTRHCGPVPKLQEK